MIRINLLPVRAARKKDFGRKQIILFALVLVGALIGNYYWYAARDSVSERLKTQVGQLNKEIKDLDRIIGEVKNIANEKQALQDKLSVLDRLKKGRTGPVKMLDAMTLAIPKNVWLKSMGESGGAMKLEGSALTHDDLAEFMKGLATVVWTPDGMGRAVEALRKGAVTSRVELSPSGQVKELSVEKVSFFFTEITLGKASQRAAPESKDKDLKVVDFTLTLKANYAI